jgi:hypothetical protein
MVDQHMWIAVCDKTEIKAISQQMPYYVRTVPSVSALKVYISGNLKISET